MTTPSRPPLPRRTLTAPERRPRPRRDERGASATEYGLLAVAIAAVITLVVVAFGDVTRELFGDTCESVKSAAAASTSCS